MRSFGVGDGAIEEGGLKPACGRQACLRQASLPGAGKPPLHEEEMLVEVAVEDGGDLLDFGEEVGEFGGEQGLHAVGEGFFGLVMDFD